MQFKKWRIGCPLQIVFNRSEAIQEFKNKNYKNKLIKTSAFLVTFFITSRKVRIIMLFTKGTNRGEKRGQKVLLKVLLELRKY